LSSAKNASGSMSGIAMSDSSLAIVPFNMTSKTDEPIDNSSLCAGMRFYKQVLLQLNNRFLQLSGDSIKYSLLTVTGKY
jgi:hypothetical protein